MREMKLWTFNSEYTVACNKYSETSTFALIFRFCSTEIQIGHFRALYTLALLHPKMRLWPGLRPDPAGRTNSALSRCPRWIWGGCFATKGKGVERKKGGKWKERKPWLRGKYLVTPLLLMQINERNCCKTTSSHILCTRQAYTFNSRT